MAKPEIEKTSARRWVWLGMALLCLGAVGVYLATLQDTVDVARRPAPQFAQTVSVLAVDQAEAVARITAFAEVRPRWNVDVHAAVSGRIETVHEGALAGTRVSAGTRLFSVERSTYEAAVRSAELAVQQAVLAQQQAANKVVVARKQYDRDSSEPPNDLALHLPQLRIAEQAVISARAQLAAARQQMADTVVIAPFSGVVTARHASLGQRISVGDNLLTLLDDQNFELVVALDKSDWALLDRPLAGKTAQLVLRDGRSGGLATIRSGGGFVDPKTRQLRVFLEVSDPVETLLAGDFVQVVFQGRTLSNTLTVPETALTRAGNIWFVDGEDRLVRHRPTVLFHGDGSLTLAQPDFPGPWRVATTPLASFLPGQRVDPIQAEGK